MKILRLSLTALLLSTFLYSSAQEVTNQSTIDSNKVLWEAALIKAQEALKDSTKMQYNVRWASQVVDFSSQYSKLDKSAEQVLGKPNVLPTGGDAITAWSVKEKKGQEYADPAFIKVSYESPIRVHQVAIGESFNPGAVTKVVIYGTEGQSETVYDKPAQPAKEKARMMNIFLQKATDYYVNQVEVFLDPIKVSGWNQIDAIGISDGIDSIKARINTIPNLVFSSKPENLGAAINTIYDEMSPMISPDGRELYFVRKFHPENAGGYKDEDDIWFSTLSADYKWTTAKNIGEPLNTKNNNYVQSITPDGNALLLANVYKRDGTVAEGVSLTYRTREGWAYPEKQIIDDYINYSPYANYFLSNDGRILLMAIERKDTYGRLDIYVSHLKEENRWSKPMNIGPIVNTIMNDYSPFLAADGVTLYYSTSGYSGYGKSDIFRTERLDDTWQNWTEPQNLGPGINTAEDDRQYNIPASGEYAYYTSTNNTIGKNDIFKIKLPEKVKPKPVVLISGKVLNDKTNQPIDARIIVEELPGGKEVAIARTNPNTGEFKIILPAGKAYGFRAIALGFFDVNLNKDYSDIDEYTEVKDEILRLVPFEVGVTVKLNNIFFEFGKATLLPESFPELDRTIRFLTDQPTVEIEIAGHTDSKGSDEFNMKLSQSRAESVMDYIVAGGIGQNRIVAKGYGETRPVAFNTTDEGRAMNRRVEFKILKK